MFIREHFLHQDREKWEYKCNFLTLDLFIIINQVALLSVQTSKTYLKS